MTGNLDDVILSSPAEVKYSNLPKAIRCTFLKQKTKKINKI